jgi:hypothetical protein
VFFQKYGGDQYITDKYTQTVIDLMLKISSTSFALNFYRDGSAPAGSLVNVDIFNYANIIKNFLPELRKDHEALTLDGAIGNLQSVYREAQKWLSSNNARAFQSLNIKKL